MGAALKSKKKKKKKEREKEGERERRETKGLSLSLGEIPAQVTTHPLPTLCHLISVASKDDVLFLFLTQVTHPSQAGDPGGWTQLYLEHCGSHRRGGTVATGSLKASVSKPQRSLLPLFHWTERMWTTQ